MPFDRSLSFTCFHLFSTFPIIALLTWFLCVPRPLSLLSVPFQSLPSPSVHSALPAVRPSPSSSFSLQYLPCHHLGSVRTRWAPPKGSRAGLTDLWITTRVSFWVCFSAFERKVKRCMQTAATILTYQNGVCFSVCFCSLLKCVFSFTHVRFFLVSFIVSVICLFGLP